MSLGVAGWLPTQLGDLFTIRHGFAFKGSHFSDEPGPIVLTPGNFEAGGGLKLRPGKDRSYTGDFPVDFVLRTDDLLVVMTDLTQEANILGAPAFVPSGLACLHNQRLGKITNVAEDRVDHRFLYFLFNSREYREHVKSTATGSTVRHTSPSRIYQHKVILPPLDEQRRIASILGAYDDLIEVNRRRVGLLEGMARGLFEEWFVRFRFPGHEAVPMVDTPDGPLPEGWKFIPLTEAAEVAYGYPFKSKLFSTEQVGSRVVRIRDVPNGRTSTWTTEPFDARYGIVDGDILVGMDGIFHTAYWIGGDAALNQRVARIRPSDGRSRGWAFWSVLPHIKYYEATISGTTVAHLGAKHLNQIKLRVASDAIQSMADRFFSTIDLELVTIRVANERLATSRDLLLPRLISGQLSVAEATRELEDAA